MKTASKALTTALMAAALAGPAGPAMAGMELDDAQMDQVAAGALSLLLGGLGSAGALSVSSSNAVATPYGDVVLGVGSSVRVGLWNNGFTSSINVTR